MPRKPIRNDGTRARTTGPVPNPNRAAVRTRRIPVLVNQAEYDALLAVALATNAPMAEVLRRDAQAAGHLPAREE